MERNLLAWLLGGGLVLAALGGAGGACGANDESSPGTGGTGTGASGGAGGGSSCTPVAETCDGTDEDCDGVPDDGPCSTPAIGRDYFMGGSGNDIIRGLAVDPAGNLYATGVASSPFDFGAGPVSGQQAFVVSFDPAGTLRWQFLWGEGSAYDYGQDIAVSATANLVCVAGTMAGTVDFGGGPHTAGGYNDALVLCLDTDGGYVFDRVFGADLADAANGVAIAPNGDVLATGAFENSADFGGGTVNGIAYNDTFVVRYGADGSFEWVRTYPGDGTEHGERVATDSAGNAFVAGMFSSVIDFGGGPRDPTPVFYGAFLLSLGPDGAYRWDHSVTDGAYVLIYGLGVQSNDVPVVAGYFTGDLALGGPVVTSASASEADVFAAGFDATGAFAWQYTAGGTGDDRLYDLAVGPNDELYVGGSFASAPMSFGDAPRSAVGSYDLVVMQLTPDGRYLWDAVFGGADSEGVNALVPDATGRLYVGGETWGDLDLGLGNHANPAGGAEGFLFTLE